MTDKEILKDDIILYKLDELVQVHPVYNEKGELDSVYISGGKAQIRGKDISKEIKSVALDEFRTYLQNQRIKPKENK